MIHGVTYFGGVQIGGDLGGSTSAPSVDSVGGSSAGDVAAATALANASTSIDTASAIVRRGASGEIAVGPINAALPTFASNAAALTGGLVAGDVYKTVVGVVLVVV